MNIDNSFFDDIEMKPLERNLYSFKDAYTSAREDMLVYVDDENFPKKKAFFWDMLPFIRFVHKDSKTVAYTTPEHLLYFNVGYSISVGQVSTADWDFIFCHECLHQIWDTFDVGKTIQKQYGACDYKLLNYASDCVINDFLYEVLGKPRPAFGIFSKDIKEAFGVDYNRFEDTQLTLYLKMVVAGAKSNPELDSKQQQTGDNTPRENEKRNNKESELDGESGEDSIDTGDGGEDSIGTSDRTTDVYTDEDSARAAQKVIDTWKNRISGEIGEFTKKCSKSKAEAGLELNTKEPDSRFDGWIEKLRKRIFKEIEDSVNINLRKTVSTKREETWSRLRRGTGFVQQGQMLKKGTKTKEVTPPQTTIKSTFFLDQSGSMKGDTIRNATAFVEGMVYMIENRYKRDTRIDGTLVDVYSFDTGIRKISLGKIPRCEGSTCSLSYLLHFMIENHSEDMINTIITDGYFESDDVRNTAKALKELKGIVILIVNTDSNGFEKLQKLSKTHSNLICVRANRDFSN